MDKVNKGVYIVYIPTKGAAKTMKNEKIKQSASRVDIEKRVKDFTRKIAGMEQTSRAYANAITTEKRFMKSHYPALRTLSKIYLQYREEVATSGEFHHLYEKNKAKLVKKHPALSLVLRGKTAKDVMEKIKRFTSTMKDKTSGLYDALKALKVAPKAYYTFKLTSGERSTIVQDDSKKVVTGKMEKIEVSREQIKEAIKDGINSKSLYERAIALSLCSGRRPVEMFKTAKFAKVDDHTVTFEGQVKGKILEPRDNYMIPIVGASVDDFLKSFGEFRNMTIGRGYDKLTNIQVNNRIASDISEKARNMLKCDGLTMYSCRHIYAHSAIEAVKDKKTDVQVFIASILGHGENDVKTALSYEKVILTDDAPKEMEGKREKRATVAPLGVKVKQETKSKTAIKAESKRLEDLKKLDVSEQGKAVKGLHDWILEHIAVNPSVTITQTYITKNRSTSRPAIKKYLELIGELASND